MSLSLVAANGMGEGGMLCCHDVSLEVKVQEEGLDCATRLGQCHDPLPAPDRLVPELQGLVWAEMLRSPCRCLILPSRAVLQETGIDKELWACDTPGRQSRETGQLWTWQGTHKGQAGEALLDGEGHSAGSCVPRAAYRRPRGDRWASLGPSAGSSPCQHMSGEHGWPGDWVLRGPRALLTQRPCPPVCAHTHVARDVRSPTTAHLQLWPPYPDLGRGESCPPLSGVRAWMLCPGSDALQPPVLALRFAHSCVTAEPPSFPGNPWGISRASKRRVTWRKGLLSNTPPRTPPQVPQTQNSFQACNQISILMRL